MASSSSRSSARASMDRTLAGRPHRRAPETTRSELSSPDPAASAARYCSYSSTTMAAASHNLGIHALVDLIHCHHVCHERTQTHDVSHAIHQDVGTADAWRVYRQCLRSTRVQGSQEEWWEAHQKANLLHPQHDIGIGDRQSSNWRTTSWLTTTSSRRRT